MNYKICVYTICKNEIESIEKWYNSLSNVDMIVLCDTGSTDGTWEYIKSINDPRFKVMQYIPEEEIFHFGNARNVSLDFVHEYCFDSDDTKWILIMLDIDEIFNEGSIERIKEQWTSDCKSMFITGYNAWNKGLENGTPQKVHSNEIQWRWSGRVHETLCYDGTPFYMLPNEYFVTGVDVSYMHYQIYDGVKHEYHSHMLKMAEENPNDVWNLRNLFGDCIDKHLWDDILKVGPILIEATLNSNENDFTKHEYPIHCYLGMSYAYGQKGDNENELKYLLEANKVNAEYNYFFRRPLSMMGDYYNKIGDTVNMLEWYSKALKKQEKNRNVVDNPYFDSDHSIYSSISMHYYYMLNDKITSLAYTELAYYLCDDEDKKKIYESDINIIMENILNEKTSGVS